MKIRNKILVVLISIFSISTIILNHSINMELIEIRDIDNLENPKISGYWTLNFIHIDGNWSDTADTYIWCNGNGSWNNPYIIENVTIDASGSPTGTGIFINNSKNDFFIIRNCTVFNAQTGLFDAGIKLENTCNGTLINCDISNNDRYGIHLYNYCMNNTISMNIIENNAEGIKFNINCSKNVISENTIISNHGIYLTGNSSNNYISKNIINEWLWGIQIDLSNDNQIIENIISYHSSFGILINGDRNNISLNYLYKNKNRAIEINYDDNIIENNIIINDESYKDYKIEDWDFGTNTIIGFNYYIQSLA